MELAAVGEMITHTQRNLRTKLSENIANGNQLFKELNKAGRVRPESGGTTILESFSLAENPNVGSYAGAEKLPTALANVSGSAEFDWKQYIASVVITGEEAAKNDGEERIISLVATRSENANISLVNRLNKDAYGDGTGNNGKNLTGLAAAITSTPSVGVYGGIDKSQLAIWRNKSIITTSSGGAATSANILGYFTKMRTLVDRSSDVTNLIIVDNNYWTILQAALQPLQRFANAEDGSVGMMNLNFMGCKIVYENTDSGIGANRAYFLNTKFLKLVPHAKRNLVAIGSERESPDQDAVTRFTGFMGNITCSGLRFQGLISD